MTSTYIDARTINLNSDKANSYYNGSFLSNLQFSFNGILKEEEDILHCQIGLLNCQIPVSFYIINEYNSSLYFNYNNIDYNLIIPYGNYNSTNLSSLLQTQMSALTNSTWLITLNKINGIYTFSTNNNFTLYGVVYGTTCCNIIGIPKEENTISNNNILICPYPVNLLGLKKLKIASSALATNTVDSWSGGFCDIIGVIPVNVSAFGLIQFTNYGNPYGLLRSKRIDEIDIKIFDEFNNLVDMNNVNWTLSLELIITRQKDLVANNTIPLLYNTQNVENVENVEDEQSNDINNIKKPDPDINNDPINPDINNELDLLLYNNQI